MICDAGRGRLLGGPVRVPAWANPGPNVRETGPRSQAIGVPQHPRKPAWLRPFSVVRCRSSSPLDYAGGLEVPSSNLGAPIRRNPCKSGFLLFRSHRARGPLVAETFNVRSSLARVETKRDWCRGSAMPAYPDASDMRPATASMSWSRSSESNCVSTSDVLIIAAVLPSRSTTNSR